MVVPGVPTGVGLHLAISRARACVKERAAFMLQERPIVAQVRQLHTASVTGTM